MNKSDKKSISIVFIQTIVLFICTYATILFVELFVPASLLLIFGRLNDFRKHYIISCLEINWISTICICSVAHIMTVIQIENDELDDDILIDYWYKLLSQSFKAAIGYTLLWDNILYTISLSTRMPDNIICFQLYSISLLFFLVPSDISHTYKPSCYNAFKLINSKVHYKSERENPIRLRPTSYVLQNCLINGSLNREKRFLVQFSITLMYTQESNSDQSHRLEIRKKQ
jgi:flagellar basal body-associated protein FliL